MASNELIDKVLGDFRLLRRLGVGGMAEFYLADQISLHRPVAVKILQEDAVGGKSSTLIKRFEQEARVAGGLSHPNIVQVYMIGQEDKLHYIVQEYVQGQNLSQWFKRNGPPDFLTGLNWMQQVASALKAADDAGIVHRDIKPENIMLTRTGVAKVTDFGLAQLNEVTRKMNLTQDGTTMGTPWYMSPEQIQGEKLDHRSDQYSFGVTCYHMFAGQPPFPGKNSVSIAVQHLKEEAKPLSSHRRDLPEAMCAIIHRMMAKRPEDRFGTPEELESALEQLNGVSLNSIDRGLTFFPEWLGRSLPPFRYLAAGLLTCCLTGIVAGRQLYPELPVIIKPAGIKDEGSAPRQYARAVLQPRNEAAWEAVFELYPMSDEALWARLQLAVNHLTKPRRDLAKADESFQELINAASIKKSEKSELLFLGYLGRAYVAEVSQKETERYDLVYTKLLTEFESQLQQESINAPEILQDYHERLREELRPAGR